MKREEEIIKAALTELKVSGDSIQQNLERILSRAGGELQSQSLQKSLEMLEKELNLVLPDLSSIDPPADLVRLLPYEAAKNYCAMPIEKVGERLHMAVVDPTDLDTMCDLRIVTGHDIWPVAGDRKQIEDLIAKCYTRAGLSGGGSSSSSSVRSVSTTQARAKGSKQTSKRVNLGGADSPIIKLVNDVISDAIRLKSSDIHFEPFEQEMKIRLRQDGYLRVHRTVNSRSKAEVVSRLKVMANLDIAEKRRPQDGRIRVPDENNWIDVRVSTLPTHYGEKVVLRLLDSSSDHLDLGRLGMDRNRLELLNHTIRNPYGMVLVTGPTGAGKTTTLYAALKSLRSPELNITTVEDPIEYKLEGIIQTAIKPEVNYSFANALRHILRQDPNVILVGEIRDLETAEISIRSALTGHMVLSTLHTNDAPSAVTRLVDMGIEPFLIASGLSMVMAQRLVRRVCDQCQEEYTPDEEILTRLGLENDGLPYRRGKGCLRCNHTGYSGRIGLFEVLNITETMKQMILEHGDALSLKRQAKKDGMITLREDGIHKAKAGITTLDEVLRESV